MQALSEEWFFSRRRGSSIILGIQRNESRAIWKEAENGLTIYYFPLT